MKENSYSKIMMVLGNTVGAVLYLFLVRSLLRGQAKSNIVGGIVSLVIVTFLIYKFICIMCRKQKISLADCRISRLSIGVSGILVGIFVSVSSVFLMSRLPGAWAGSHLSGEYILAVIIPYLIDWGLASGINEEMIFRGYLLKIVEKNYGKKAALVFTSLLFGVLHLANDQLTVTEALLFFTYTASTGLLLAVITLKSGHIWNSVVVHALINSISVIVTFGENTEFVSPFIYTFSDSIPTWIKGSESFSLLLNTGIIWAALILYLAVKYLYDRKRGKAGFEGIA